MKKTIVFALAVLVCGCGSDKSSPVARARTVANEMCACKDSECVKAVTEKQKRLDKAENDREPSRAEAKELRELYAQYKGCRRHVLEKLGKMGAPKLMRIATQNRDRMCACTNAKCVYEAKKRQKASRKKMRLEDLSRLSKADVAKFRAIVGETRKCRRAMLKKDGQNHPVVKKLAAIADEVCACKDKACAKAANAKAKAKTLIVVGLRQWTKPLVKKRLDCFLKLLTAK